MHYIFTEGAIIDKYRWYFPGNVILNPTRPMSPSTLAFLFCPLSLAYLVIGCVRVVFRLGWNPVNRHAVLPLDQGMPADMECILEAPIWWPACA